MILVYHITVLRTNITSQTQAQMLVNHSRDRYRLRFFPIVLSLALAYFQKVMYKNVSFRRCGREKTLINPYYPHRCEFYIQCHISKYKCNIKKSRFLFDFD